MHLSHPSLGLSHSPSLPQSHIVAFTHSYTLSLSHPPSLSLPPSLSHAGPDGAWQPRPLPAGPQDPQHAGAGNEPANTRAHTQRGEGVGVGGRG